MRRFTPTGSISCADRTIDYLAHPDLAGSLARGAGSGNGHCVVVVLNPPGQYADDGNLSARQRLWQYQTPFFDIAGWVLSLAGLSPGLRVLDAGCGNGEYLRSWPPRVVLYFCSCTYG